MRSNNSEARSSLREHNLSAVLRIIYHEAPLSRAQLAGRTGLNKSTISDLVEELLDRRLVHETGTAASHKGRPGTLLQMSPQAGAVVAVEMGVDFVSAALVDFLGGILWRTLAAADPAASQQETIGLTFRLVEQAVAACRRADRRILGLSFAMPGTVDLDQGLLIFAPNLHWRNVAFRQIFSAGTGLKVFVENDANAAALAEYLFGVARNLRDFLFVFAGVGLGGGLFLDGRLYRGKGGYSGEIGHMPIMAEPFQNPCHCGNLGCWETYVNQGSILQRVSALLQSSHDCSLIRSLMEEERAPLSLAIIIRAAESGDPVALQALAETGSAMGMGFAVLVNIFNPRQIVLGGPTSAAGRFLMPSIRESVQRHAMSEIVSQAEINLSAFGPDASLIGAAAVVIDDILMYPSHIEKEVMPPTEMQPVASLT